MEIKDIDLTYYGLYVTGYTLEVNTGIDNISINLSSTIPPKYSELAKDLTVINKVRKLGKDSPAYNVYEKLLMTLALST